MNIFKKSEELPDTFFRSSVFLLIRGEELNPYDIVTILGDLSLHQGIEDVILKRKGDVQRSGLVVKSGVYDCSTDLDHTPIQHKIENLLSLVVDKMVDVRNVPGIEEMFLSVFIVYDFKNERGRSFAYDLPPSLIAQISDCGFGLCSATYVGIADEELSG